MTRAALFALLLSGCASGMVPMSTEPVPPDWPLLKTSYWFGEPADVVAKCYDSVPVLAKFAGGVAIGCAYIDWKAMTCGINVAYGDYRTLAHELSHCYGSTHVLGDAYLSWKEHLHSEFDSIPDLKAYYYLRASDGKMVKVTRPNYVLHFETLK